MAVQQKDLSKWLHSVVEAVPPSKRYFIVRLNRYMKIHTFLLILFVAAVIIHLSISSFDGVRVSHLVLSSTATSGGGSTN